MCGIAGRILEQPGLIGVDLVALMQAQAHRGSDSTGFALYGEPRQNSYVVRGVASDRRALDQTLDGFLQTLRAHDSDLIEDPSWDDTTQRHVSLRMIIGELDVRTWLAEADLQEGLEIQSVGRSLEIVKDLGISQDVSLKHNITDFVGSHGIANARMATESRVSPTASHPFWARPFPDIAIVHNGQLTNYFGLKARLQRQGYTFLTENDSELIAVWISDQLSRGLTLEEALHSSVRALDGVFTYIISTPTQIGMAKDRWAIKPLAVFAHEQEMATATEEQAVRKLYTGEVPISNLDGPGYSTTWDVLPAGRA